MCFWQYNNVYLSIDVSERREGKSLEKNVLLVPFSPGSTLILYIFSTHPNDLEGPKHLLQYRNENVCGCPDKLNLKEPVSNNCNCDSWNWRRAKISFHRLNDVHFIAYLGEVQNDLIQKVGWALEYFENGCLTEHGPETWGETRKRWGNLQNFPSFVQKL